MDESIKGKWLGVVRSPGDLRTVGDERGCYGVHAALLKSGRVILWSGRVESSGYLYRSWTWDATSFSEGDTELEGVQGRWFLSDFDIGGSNESPPGPVPRWSDERTIDLFCAHHTNLEDGRLLVVGGAGGRSEGDARGNPAIYFYDPDAEQWTKADEELRRGRWYPTPVTLADGRVAVFSGRQNGSNNPERSAEIIGAPNFSPTEIDGGSKELYIYPGMMMVRGGRVFYVPTNWMIENGPTTALNKINPTSALRMTSRTSATWETFPDPADPANDLGPINPWREEGTFVLLPPAQAGRIMMIGGGFAENALGDSDQRPVARPDHCEILETQGDSPRWVEAGTLRHSRVNVHAVLLPDGKVFIVGGHDSVKRNPAHIDRLIGEIYDPTVAYDPADPSAAFTETNPLQRSRNYHGAALLLPDGRVLLTGGEDNAHHGGNQTSVEIYEPPYLHNGPQPAIENVSVTNAPEDEIAYGANFTIRCRDELEASNIAQVVLMRPGSATHHTDTEQRHVPLNFSYVSGDTLRATAPLDATVAPPGYYMLWIVDGSGIPCERAPFVRLSYRKCSLITDRSSISIQEIEALPSRTIESAVYVHLDGFLPAELGVTTPTPSAELIDAWAPRVSASDDGTTLTNVRLDPVEMLLEDPAMPADLRQRVTFRYRVIFDDFGAFPEDGGPDRNRLRLDVNYRDWSCDGRLDLTRQPAPYMLDGATHWLSTDVRVFRIREGESRFGVTLETGQPLRFLRDVIAAFDADPGLASHPFESIATDQSESRLQLATTEGGTPVYNFAICRARYRANSVNAQRVRMHFRAFTTAATNLNYNPATTYRSATTASSKIALPGIASGELVTIPFFGRERVNAATTALTDQTDDLNQKDLPALASGAEARRYFGAFLDLNQPDAQLPASLNPSENGPFDASDLQPLAELVRGRHQCLVAEIDFDDLPIDVGESPANNDMLSQRNLIIEGSDNPGASDSHTVAMTFDIKPTWSVREGAKNADIPPVNETRWPLTHRPAAHHGSEHDEVVTETGHHDHNDINPLADRPTHAPAPERIVGHLALGDLLGKRTDFMRDDPIGARFAPAHHEHRSPPDFSWFTPDDLMIEWGELPESSVATLYLPNLPAENIVRAARLRSPWPRMEAVDAHTLKLGVGGVSHVPLPGLSSRRLAGLLTVQLPESVRYGQEFSVVVRQASNRHSVIVGAFELRVPVRSVDELATDEARWYAVLQQIIQKMNPDNRWHAVLSRLRGIVRGRVNGFGIDADAIKPGLDPRDLEDPCPCAPAKERPEQADGDCEERKPDTPQACPNPYCECDPCLCLPPCKCGLTLDTRKTTTHWNDKKKRLHHKTVEVYKPKGD